MEGIPGITYVLEASSNLSAWSAIATNLGAPFDFADTPRSRQRFYRVLRGTN